MASFDNAGPLQPAAKKTRRPLNWFLMAFYGLLGLAVVGLVAFVTIRPIQVLPRITLAPGFTLTDQDGARLTNEDLRGSITLYNLTYTNCRPPDCLDTSTAVQAVRGRLADIDTQGIPVRFVTISVDPARDDQAALQAYATEIGADGETWHVATGDVERLKWIVGGGFGVYFDARDDGSIVLDPPALILVDGLGIMRAEYRTAAPEADRILRDMRLVAQEARNSTGTTRYAYEAAHLFLCYPRG